MAEQAFVKAFLSMLSAQPTIYDNDYQQPPHNSLKKVPVLQIILPALPENKSEAATSSAFIAVTFKSLKPPQSFTISLQPTDTISDIKVQLASEPKAPPADAQRLLLKGKALADTKLLKEYNIKEGDTVNLVVKPGFEWDPSKPTKSSLLSPKEKRTMPTTGSKSDVLTRRHQRIPSVILTPSPSSVSPSTEKPMDITLALDTASIAPMSGDEHSSYHTTVAQPGFWERLHSFLRSEFSTETDALLAFEDYLRASKGTLTASEIAKIRDEVGVIGMAGT
jgi:UV excision repair protein RAD23